jgi:hypothetical protein
VFSIPKSHRPNFVKFKDGGILWLDFHSLIQAILMIGAALLIGDEILYIYENYILSITPTGFLGNIDIDNFIEEYEILIEEPIFEPVIPKNTLSNNQILINALLKSIEIYILPYGKKLPKILKSGILYFIPTSVKHNNITNI